MTTQGWRSFDLRPFACYNGAGSGCVRAAILIFVAMLFSFVPVSTQVLEPTEMERLDAVNREFYEAMRERAAETDRIPLEALVPVEWDRVIACDPYAGEEEMWRLAGSRFSEVLSFGGYNEMFSLIFMCGDEVVWFVHEAFAPYRDAFYSKNAILRNNNDTFLRREDPYLYVNFDSGFAQVRSGAG